MNNSFPSKILLFGEYAIIKGAHGLAIPFNKFSGHLELSNEQDKYKKEFISFYDYLKNSQILSEELDLEKFKEDIDSNLYFESNIPKGAGVGSSGALCAAIFYKYLKPEYISFKNTDTHLNTLLDRMALMESFYHGSSSGLDPLISFVNKIILVKNRNDVKKIDDQIDLTNFFLYQTGIKRKTTPLVHLFLEKCQDQSFVEKLNDFIQLNDNATNQLVEGNKEAFNETLMSLSKWQYLNLSEMIVNDVKELWLEGIENKEYSLKLCGAGGGGHYLVYLHNNNIKKKLINNNFLSLT